MAEPAERITTIPKQSARKRSNDRLVRRLTTGSVSFAICLTGTFAGFAWGSLAGASGGVRLDIQPTDSGSAALSKALADYEAAVAALAPPAAPTPAPSRPSAPPGAAPPATRPTVVSGGS